MEFENPVLPGMHPDPTICRVGRDFYLACSSFEYFPGVPIFHSRDLVGWRQIGHALTRKSQLDLSGVRSSGGIYAPTLRHHDGTFYLVTTLVGRGNFLVTAKHPRGPWSDPCWLDSDGIDPSLAFLDGRVYYTRNGPGADPDHPFVYQAELAWSGRSAVPRPQAARDLEGHRRYLARGAAPVSPRPLVLPADGGGRHELRPLRRRGAEPPAVRPVRSHRRTGRSSPTGTVPGTRSRPPATPTWSSSTTASTWAVLLGIRPAAGRNHHLGRETFLAPVTWGDGRLAADVAARAEHGRAVASTLGTARVGRARRFRHAARSRRAGSSSATPRARAGRCESGRAASRLWGLPASLATSRPLPSCAVASGTSRSRRARLLEFEPQRAKASRPGLCVRANEDFHVALLVGLGERGRELRLVRTLARTEPDARDDGARPRAGDAVRRRQRRAQYAFIGGAGGSLTCARTRTDDGALGGEDPRAAAAGITSPVRRSASSRRAAGRRSTVPADFHWFEYAGG